MIDEREYQEMKKAIARLERLPVIDYVALTDYSATSTIVGWSAYTTKAIKYKMIGGIYRIFFNIAGTSNSTTTSFTLPITLTANWVISRPLVRGVDNSVAVTAYARIPSGTLPGNNVSFFLLDGSAFRATGTKSVEGQFSVYSD